MFAPLSTSISSRRMTLALSKSLPFGLQPSIPSTFLCLSNLWSFSSPVPSRKYHEKVLDHYEQPRNVGSMNKLDPSVGTGIVGAPACGDVMKLQIRVDERSGKIQSACFKTFGCGSAIASSSLATEWVQGLSLDEASKITNKSIAKELSLPPVKLHCSMLAEDAIRAAIQDYQKKKMGGSVTSSTNTM
ncbi:iron-binding protein [Coelomomyces lativittatus]|nr:iron-binding protein [Coelomomyces lativittatus]